MTAPEADAASDATLATLALTDGDGNTVALSPEFSPDWPVYRAMAAEAVDAVTVAATKNDANALGPTFLDASGLALTDADTGTPGFQVALAEGANTFKVRVSAEDIFTMKTYTVVVTRASPPLPPLDPPVANAVETSWALIPSGLGVDDEFRLIFVSNAIRDASSSDIADYNTFVQNRAAAGHMAIREFSSEFRVVASSATVDAQDNTATTGTGVPIYWLNGAKVADDYVDFYDGDWDDEANPKNEFGTAPNTFFRVFTGSNHDGTKQDSGFAAIGGVWLGRPNVETGVLDSDDAGPVGGGGYRNKAGKNPFYGLSPVFTVVAEVDRTAPTLESSATLLPFSQ